MLQSAESLRQQLEEDEGSPSWLSSLCSAASPPGLGSLPLLFPPAATKFMLDGFWIITKPEDFTQFWELCCRGSKFWGEQLNWRSFANPAPSWAEHPLNAQVVPQLCMAVRWGWGKHHHLKPCIETGFSSSLPALQPL